MYLSLIEVIRGTVVMHNINLQTAPFYNISFFLWHSTHSQFTHQEPFDSKIILVAEDYSTGSVKGVEISGRPRIGGGCGLDVCEHTTGIGHEKMFKFTSIHVAIFIYLVPITWQPLISNAYLSHRPQCKAFRSGPGTLHCEMPPFLKAKGRSLGLSWSKILVSIQVYSIYFSSCYLNNNYYIIQFTGEFYNTL